jgi:hypothetical protein
MQAAAGKPPKPFVYNQMASLGSWDAQSLVWVSVSMPSQIVKLEGKPEGTLESHFESIKICPTRIRRTTSSVELENVSL